MKHIFYFEFDGWRYITELDSHDDFKAGLGNIKYLPLMVLQVATKIYNITTRTILKDRTREYFYELTLAELQECFDDVSFVTQSELITESEGIFGRNLSPPKNLCSEISLGEPFDPEFESGCWKCDKVHLMREMYYEPDTGHHTCEDCFNKMQYDQAIKVIKPNG